MGILEAIILGILQGLTEFLPVSSSGHLELGKALFPGQVSPKESLFFTIVVHVGTCLSTIVVFRAEIKSIFQGLITPQMNEEKRFSIKVVLSMIPAAFVGLFWEDVIDTLFSENVLLVGCGLLFTALLLFLSEKLNTKNRELTYVNAFVIGVSQAVAILPGISRSGSTIASSLILGVDRAVAARFSFLMVIPLIFGKLAKDILFNTEIGVTTNTLPLLLGFITSFIVGIFACSWMIRLVKSSKLVYFSIYCLIIGLIAIGYSCL